MEIICTSCSTKLAIPDAKVPKNAVFRVTCPKCQTKVRVSTMPEQAAPRAGVAPTAPVLTRPAPPHPPQVPEEPMEEFDSSDIKDEGLASSPAEEEFEEDRKLAMVCIVSTPQQETVKTTLDGLSSTVLFRL